MIAKIIQASCRHRVWVLTIMILLSIIGVWVTKHVTVDAIPDLSDVQVIIKATYAGRSPQVVENQVTYPLTTTLMGVPGAKAVRGYSFYGDAYVYILFEEGTDLYWARSRVLEYFNQALNKLPPSVKIELGPDATGVGWIYEYALVDKTGKHDISELRSLQDWFLKYELRSVPGVAEVATLGGMVKTYQIIINPQRLRAYKISIDMVAEAIKKNNEETGGAVLELAEAEYMIKASGYLQTIDDFKNIPLGIMAQGSPVLLKDVATIQFGPQMRRGIAELDGQGEVVGGVVIMRANNNALATIQGVKNKLELLKQGLPKGVEIVTTYDRSGLIERAIDNLKGKLIEESIVVALVCLIFLFHVRSALVAIVSLPIGILLALVLMYFQGINANIMSLGGIAIAIGAMVDAAIVMIENAHKHLEHWHKDHPNAKLSGPERWKLIVEASIEVGPALFFSLLIITVSFLPVFSLQAQEGRLFTPLALTKTYAMTAAAILSITLVPVLMGYCIFGKILSEDKHPLTQFLIKIYQPGLIKSLKHPKIFMSAAFLLLVLTLYPILRIGSEFMPPLMEGDLLYMPTALPSLSIGKASQLLQQTDAMIKTFPEVETVFGKMGRAETATDPAPIEMMETTIQLKPRSQWRSGMTMDKLITELDNTIKVPGLVNVWVQPIRNRIDMLATGIKSPVGIKVTGTDLNTLEKLGVQMEELLKILPGTASVVSERYNTGRYIEVNIDRAKAAHCGLNIQDIHDLITRAIGGEDVGEVVSGLTRYPINMRLARDLRDTVQKLNELPILTPQGAVLTLGSVAEVKVVLGPPMIKTENTRPSVWVYVDIRNEDLGTYVKNAKKLINEKVNLPTGYNLAWSGQYEYLERAAERMKVVIPFAIGLIAWLLYLIFSSFLVAAIILLTIPFALIGGFWLVYILGFNLSVAVAVGFIALGGVAAEFGVVMWLYLEHAVEKYKKEGRLKTIADLQHAILEGAVLRVRPKAMTVAVIMAGLLPIMLGDGTGSDVMQRIAAPMIGGMITAPILSLFIIPILFYIWQKRKLN